MSKENKKEIPEGIITVTVPFVKRREFGKNVKYEGRGNRIYRVPLNIFHDKLKNILQGCEFNDEIISQKTFIENKNEKCECKEKVDCNEYFDTPYKFNSKLCYNDLIDMFKRILSEE